MTISVVLSVCLVILLIKQKKILATILDLQNQLSITENLIDAQEYKLSSISETYLNSFQVSKRNFRAYVSKTKISEISDTKATLFFVNSDKDCDLCVDNEMFLLDSLSSVFEGNIIVLRYFSDVNDINFFSNNFSSIKEIYPLTKEGHQSFFTGSSSFPFYALVINSLYDPIFFAPHADFQGLSSRFLQMNLSNY